MRTINALRERLPLILPEGREYCRREGVGENDWKGLQHGFNHHSRLLPSREKQKKTDIEGDEKG